MSESPVIEGVFVGREMVPLTVSSQVTSFRNAAFLADRSIMTLCVGSSFTSNLIDDLILRKVRCRVRTHLDKAGRLRVISITELDAVEEPTYFNPSKFLQALRDMP